MADERDTETQNSIADGSETESLDTVLTAEEEPEEESAGEKTGGWKRVLRGNKGLWVTALVAVIALVAGLAIGHFVVSPFDAAAGERAPDPGLVTVPVEYGELSNDVTMRGDVAYADAAQLDLDTTSFEGAAIVTGQVPEVGDEFHALSIALEVTGRPVIVLPGELPAYRTLRVGVAGPDVVQLKQALAEVGIDAGDPESDVFDEATANAVGALYTEVGYPAPAPEEGADEAVRMAEDGVRSAEQMLTEARSALAEASQGPSEIEIRRADSEVDSIWRQIVALEDQGQDARDLRDQLEIAKLTRAELDQPRDASAEQAMVDGAIEAVEQANQALAEARRDALPYLPASEALFLEELPRRVDSVNVKRGATLGDDAMTVSGASVRMSGTAAQADVELLEVGDEAMFELPDGTPHRAEISEIDTSSGERVTIVFEPDPLTPEQLDEVRGANVRIEIPVGATDGDVLSVPYAALTAGPGGDSRVEVVDGDPRDGERAETHLVTVETGLAADGYVEITPTDGDLEAGELVVVGS